MSRPRSFVVAFVAAAALASAGTAGAYHTRFVADNCNINPPQPTSYITREGSTTVALRARYEGYQWAGGCWNDNDRDDSPNDPHEDPNTGGEGPDCSGFTFKVWREALSTSDGSFDQWGMLRTVHGPYTAAAFKAGSGAPNTTVSKSALIPMDALASDGHIGLIYAENPGRIGSDHRGQGRGLRHEHLDANVPRQLELQRCSPYRLELTGSASGRWRLLPCSASARSRRRLAAKALTPLPAFSTEKSPPRRA